jgi:hypothetical protein
MSKWPIDTLDDEMFKETATETVSEGWPVFGKMKALIKDIINSHGQPLGITPLDSQTKIPLSCIPDIPFSIVEGDIPTSMIEGKFSTDRLKGDIPTSMIDTVDSAMLTGTINDDRLSANVAMKDDIPTLSETRYTGWYEKAETALEGVPSGAINITRHVDKKWSSYSYIDHYRYSYNVWIYD